MQYIVVKNTEEYYKLSPDELKANLVCSCGCEKFILWDSYERRLIHADGQTEMLIVQRVMCSDKNCGKTHAVLPSFVLGKAPYVADAVEEAIMPLVDENISVSAALNQANETCLVPKSRATFQSWVRRIKKRYSMLIGPLQASLMAIASNIDLSEFQSDILNLRGPLATGWLLAKQVLSITYGFDIEIIHTPLTFLNWFCWRRLGVSLLSP